MHFWTHEYLKISVYECLNYFSGVYKCIYIYKSVSMRFFRPLLPEPKAPAESLKPPARRPWQDGRGGGGGRQGRPGEARV